MVSTAEGALRKQRPSRRHVEAVEAGALFGWRQEGFGWRRDPKLPTRTASGRGGMDELMKSDDVSALMSK